jgi:hypothetical protein
MRTRPFLSLFFLFVLALTACSSPLKPESPESSAVKEMPAPAGAPEVAVEMPAATQAPAIAEAPAALEAQEAFAADAGVGGLPYPGAAPLPQAQATIVPEEAAGGVGGGVPQALLPSTAGRMVIKDAMIELLVHDLSLAVQQATQLAADQGGYLLSSESSQREGAGYATLRLGVPSAAFEETLNKLRGMGLQVLNETTSGQDVSAEYTDLKSRLANLEATAARVREFLADAKTVEESLRINATLSELEGQIEQVKGQMNYYEGRSAFSTITVVLTPDVPTPTPTATPTATPTPTPTPGWNPANTFDDASHVFVRLGQSAVDMLIWLAVLAGPLLILAGIVLLIARLLRRSVSRPGKSEGTP